MTDGESFGWVEAELAKLDRAGLRRSLVTRTSPQQAWPIETAGGKLVNFGSNDYLSLASDRRLIQAAKLATEQAGVGSGASPLVTGFGTYHEQLAARLASLEQTEAALLLVSGYAANVAAITTLVSRGDLILSDERNHASIIDGCRLSGATIAIYRHGDAAHAGELLLQHASARRKLIVTDSLFSMDGDIAPLAQLADLADAHQAMLLVDEAHATGVFGERGSGLVEALGLKSRIAVRVGTMSKALGSSGGFIVGPQVVIDWMTSTARSFIFSTAGTEAAAAAAVAAIDIVEQEPERRARLMSLCDHLRSELAARGISCGTGRSQIVPIIVGDPQRTMQLASKLRERGMWVPGIRPPSVPVGESLLRISLTSSHSREQLDRLVDEVAKLMRE